MQDQGNKTRLFQHPTSGFGLLDQLKKTMTMVNTSSRLNVFKTKHCRLAKLQHHNYLITIFGVIQKSNVYLDTSPKSQPALWLHSSAAPSVEAHHHVKGSNTGRNSDGRWIAKKRAIYSYTRQNHAKYCKSYFSCCSAKRSRIIISNFKIP